LIAIRLSHCSTNSISVPLSGWPMFTLHQISGQHLPDWTVYQSILDCLSGWSIST
jgi:hypothetical protein